MPDDWMIGCWVLGVGCWMLDVGCWLLDVGCWMLVVGCWMLGVLGLLRAALSHRRSGSDFGFGHSGFHSSFVIRLCPRLHFSACSFALAFLVVRFLFKLLFFV